MDQLAPDTELEHLIGEDHGSHLLPGADISSLHRWRRVRVGCADFDWRILLQAGLKLTDDLRYRVGDSSVVRANVALLFPVGKQVDDLRQRQLLRHVVHAVSK
jgi:hypothetical protein